MDQWQQRLRMMRKTTSGRMWQSVQLCNASRTMSVKHTCNLDYRAVAVPCTPPSLTTCSSRTRTAQDVCQL